MCVFIYLNLLIVLYYAVVSLSVFDLVVSSVAWWDVVVN